ncbi:hypothetical protein FK545_17270 [Planococcus glaciei]|nr:hypothetical protein [Planococcus glaciei]QDY46468.1 hypothetical protein FK545_17270 [Planococcus glaciei]
MEWLNYVVPILFICMFIYGFVKQVQQSVLLYKIVSPNNPFNKRMLLGNHLYSFSFGGFVTLLILNGFFLLGSSAANRANWQHCQPGFFSISAADVYFQIRNYTERSVSLPNPE